MKARVEKHVFRVTEDQREIHVFKDSQLLVKLSGAVSYISMLIDKINRLESELRTLRDKSRLYKKEAI